MSYEICYHKEKRPSHKGYWISYLLAAVLAFMAITNGFYHFDGKFYGLRQQLMPWTQPHVRAAFRAFSDHLGEGMPLADSVEAFVEAVAVD